MGTRTILCGEAAAGVRGGTADVLCLRQLGPDGEVHLCIDDVARSLYRDVPPQFEDLIEIATFVYIADQAHTRGGDGVENMGAEWRRQLHFEVPVRCLDLWRRPDVADALQGALGFLSEDTFTFAFRRYVSPPALTQFIGFADADWGYKPESVVLFSGGLDSLGGAVQEVVTEGRAVALVTHRSSDKFVNRLRMLRGMLDERAKGPKPLHITVGINKDKRFNHEYTQRSRSFLYASLGATIARMCGLDEVRFYENGTVSLNLPISRQVVGAKATRTTHPRTLASFARLFSSLDGRPVRVTNGFLWKTKAEVVKLIVDAGCEGMIEWSTSCTHTWETSNQHPHCGRCSQCIDRRFATLAAGAGAFDPARGYAVDLLTQSRDEGEPRTMLASYVETAQEVARMPEMDFFIRFGEVGRIVRQLGEPTTDQNARNVYDLYRRHAQGVVRVVREGIAKHSEEILARSLPESCLLRLVHDPSVPAEWGGPAGQSIAGAAEAPAAPAYVFAQCGEGWRLRFDGHEAVWLRPLLGHAYLRELLRSPHRRLSVSALLVAVHGQKADLPLGDGGDDLDAQAKRAYARRLAELDADLDEARRLNDVGQQGRLGDERARLLEQLRAAGFKRSSRRTDSDVNRLRNSVCNAIGRALATIKRYEPSAYEHLRRSISKGFTVTYQPGADVPWSFV